MVSRHPGSECEKEKETERNGSRYTFCSDLTDPCFEVRARDQKAPAPSTGRCESDECPNLMR